jgi:Fe-S cluster assembly protein SufD
METLMKEGLTREHMISLWEQNRALITRNDPAGLPDLRNRAMAAFSDLGFPHTKLESWRHTDLKESLGKGYDVWFTPRMVENPARVFQCNIPHLDTAVIGLHNGWYVSKEVPLMELGNGIIMGSLAEAMKKYPDLVNKHYGRYSDDRGSSLTALNTAFAQDGIFIFVPDGVKSPKPVQLINVIHDTENLMLQARNLVILGDDSRLSLVHCDDSYNHQPSFSNVVTEIRVGARSEMDHYKLQNINNQSTLVSSVYFNLGEEAMLDSHYLSLNGGLLRNDISVRFDGPRSHANLYGLYLMDKKQHIDNHLFIDHASPECTSNELFKGILDENATGVFNGHVLVRKHAVKTDARQSNRNILTTDTARVHSKPFLEIYNDDVKCSHGSTTGQLDQEAMFYLRQRGIGEDNARMLLMFAFADEVVSKVAIDPLRYRIEDMIKKRLQGELQICEQCVLHCNTPEHPLEFKIDLSKI